MDTPRSPPPEYGGPHWCFHCGRNDHIFLQCRNRCLHCETFNHPFNFCLGMPREQYAKTSVANLQSELERAKNQVEDDFNELPKRTVADISYEAYYHELAERQKGDYRQQMLEKEPGVQEEEEHAIIAGQGPYGGEAPSRGGAAEAAEEDGQDSQRLIPWREPGTIQSETFDYGLMFQNMREKAALDAIHERREDIKTMSRARPSPANLAGARNMNRVFDRFEHLKRKDSPLGTTAQPGRNKKPRPEEYLQQDEILRTENSGKRYAFRRNADAPRPVSRHLQSETIDPRPGAASVQRQRAATNNLPSNALTNGQCHGAQRVDDARFQALYERFKKQMGEAASRSMPKGYSRSTGYGGSKWRHSKADHASTKPGEAFLAGTAVLLGPDSTISKDDPQRIDTPWGPVLLKVRFVIVIAVYDTYLEVIVLTSRGWRGLDDILDPRILKKFMQFFHKSHENEASTLSPWDPVMVHGFNQDRDKRSFADITKLYRVDFDQQMLPMGYVERPGLKQILQVIDSPDGAVGKTSAKIKESLAAINAQEAIERVAAMPRGRNGVALPAPPAATNDAHAQAPDVPTAAADPPPPGVGIVNNARNDHVAPQSLNQRATAGVAGPASRRRRCHRRRASWDTSRSYWTDAPCINHSRP